MNLKTLLEVWIFVNVCIHSIASLHVTYSVKTIGKLYYFEISARRNTEEEKDLQEVHLSWSGLRSAVGHASVSRRGEKIVGLCD